MDHLSFVLRKNPPIVYDPRYPPTAVKTWGVIYYILEKAIGNSFKQMRIDIGDGKHETVTSKIQSKHKQKQKNQKKKTLACIKGYTKSMWQLMKK